MPKSVIITSVASARLFTLAGGSCTRAVTCGFGTTALRHLACTARTPWYLTSGYLGGGTSAESLAKSSIGVITPTPEQSPLAKPLLASGQGRVWTSVPRFSERDACQPAGTSGVVQLKSQAASTGARLTQPWLLGVPKSSCQ